MSKQLKKTARKIAFRENLPKENLPKKTAHLSVWKISLFRLIYTHTPIHLYTSRNQDKNKNRTMFAIKNLHRMLPQSIRSYNMLRNRAE